ncbi:hypothetical protein ACQJBY_019239 [Aegilops geniculata]
MPCSPARAPISACDFPFSSVGDFASRIPPASVLTVAKPRSSWCRPHHHQASRPVSSSTRSSAAFSVATPSASSGRLHPISSGLHLVNQSQNAHAETSNATKQSSRAQSVQLHEVTKQVRGFRKGVHCTSQEQLQMNNLQMNKYYR